MVRSLHAAGLEVILDVVYNHSCEGNERGPTLSFRGIDNATYYWLEAQDRSQSRDFTGCGNALATHRSLVLKLVLDSLRYWVREMHVDGFRFDLATTLARGRDGGVRPARGLLRRALPGPGALPREADRRAVGRGAARLPPGQLPHAVRRVERSVPHRPCGASGGAITASWPSSARGSRAARTSSRSRGGAPARRSTTSPATTASPSPIWSATSASTTRPTASRTATAPTRTSRRTGARRATPTMRRCSPGAIAPRATCSPRSSSASAPPCCWRATSWAAASAATTTPTARTTSCPGSTGSYAPQGSAAALHPGAGLKLRLSQPVLQRRGFFLGESLDDSRFRDLVWFHPAGNELGHDDWREPRAAVLRDVPGRRRHRRPGAQRRQGGG